MRIKLTLGYNGKAYCGWQYQPQRISVQQTLSEAIEKLTGRAEEVTGSGRTDAGVHALGQVAHFDTQKVLPTNKIKAGLNFYLPSDIRIFSVEEVSSDFHARFSAKRKTYEYAIYFGDQNPIYDDLAWQQEKPINIEKMSECALLIEGEHDFSGFMSGGSEVSSTVRTVFDAHFYTRNEFLIFSITADGFLYNMVRRIVAALVKAGMGKTDKEEFAGFLTGKKFIGIAPAKGLYLKEVVYI